MSNLRTLYDSNKDFRQYVDKYAAQRSMSVEETLTHALVREIGKYYESKGEAVK